MVTICTTSLTFNNSTFCPHTVFMCFVWISEQTAIISLYNINCLVFITEMEIVYCAVRTGYLYKIQVNFCHRSAKARVRSQASPSKICWGPSVTGRGFSLVTSASPVSNIPPVLHTHLHLSAALTTTNGQCLGTFQKEELFRE